MTSGVGLAFALTLFAGMATGIGSLIAFTAKRTNYRFLSVATGFSAGVMLYVSFVEILTKSRNSLSEHFPENTAMAISVGSFFGGMALIGLVDLLVPASSNPHEVRSEAETAPIHDPSAKLPDPGVTPAHSPHLLRMGLFTALAITIHNFPEGLVTFLSALESPALGIAVAIAVALHNIPEGISVSVPVYYATGSRRKALLYSSLSGLAEPLGALVAWLLLQTVLGGELLPNVTGVLFAGVAGVMVYISLDELLPTSRAYGKGHDSLLGVMAGMAIMALSLVLLAA